MLRKLVQLDAAEGLDDLRVPPENRLEALKGDRRGQHSIRVNDQWRICFWWAAGNAYDVEIFDYHGAGGGTATNTKRATERLDPIYPGEVLLEDFLVPMGLSRYRLAKDISVPPRRINEIVLGRRSITADTALRLGRYLRTTEQFCPNPSDAV
jgi:addiction module HigA family antidote